LLNWKASLKRSDILFDHGILAEGTMKKQTLISFISQAITAYKNCEKSGNTEWKQKWENNIARCEMFLPSGAGIDSGTQIDIESSKDNCLVLNFSFHFMNEVGMYDGWETYKAKITPTFAGIDVKVIGKNRNDIKEYLGDTMRDYLETEYSTSELYS
jgi:hypothetical protein